MGVSIDDKELAMTLLASLPEEFKPLITTLDPVSEDNLSHEKVKRYASEWYCINPKKSEDAFSAKQLAGTLQQERKAIA